MRQFLPGANCRRSAKAATPVVDQSRQRTKKTGLFRRGQAWHGACPCCAARSTLGSVEDRAGTARESRSMENALLIGLSRQVALGRELDVIANNMANVTTNGFKARSSRFREYLMPVASAETFPRPDRRLSYVIDNGTPLDTRSGAVEHTGSPLDVAIKGDAFLAVQTPQGERYTRNGALEI